MKSGQHPNSRILVTKISSKLDRNPLKMNEVAFDNERQNLGLIEKKNSRTIF